MPNINVEITDELLKAIRIKCAEENVAQKDWVPRVLADALGLDSAGVGTAGAGDAAGAGRVGGVPNPQKAGAK
jgi:hypothetical protein